MSARTKTLLVLVAIILLLAIPLWLLLLDEVRQVLLGPLLPFVQAGQLLSQAIPQALLWALGLLLAGAVALRSLNWRPGPAPQRSTTTGGSTGPVRAWTHWLREQGQGGYFKKRLAHRLGRLAVQALAPYERLTAQQARRLLDRLDAPPEIRAYLQAGFEPEPPATLTGSRILARLKSRIRVNTQRSPLDLDPEEVVRFLETQLEVYNDHNTHL
jgi:hypothetical protein